MLFCMDDPSSMPLHTLLTGVIESQGDRSLRTCTPQRRDGFMLSCTSGMSLLAQECCAVLFGGDSDGNGCAA